MTRKRTFFQDFLSCDDLNNISCSLNKCQMSKNWSSVQNYIVLHHEVLLGWKMLSMELLEIEKGREGDREVSNLVPRVTKWQVKG